MDTSHPQLDHETFILDAYLNKPLDEAKKESWTRSLVDNLLTALEMEELGPLQIYPGIDLRSPGWSFVQPINACHISGHYFERPGKQPHLRLDCYSCTSADWKAIIDVCSKC